MLSRDNRLIIARGDAAATRGEELAQAPVKMPIIELSLLTTAVAAALYMCVRVTMRVRV